VLFVAMVPSIGRDSIGSELWFVFTAAPFGDGNWSHPSHNYAIEADSV